MARVVVDIGSKVVRALDTDKHTELFKFEHTLGSSLSLLGPEDDYKRVLSSRKFEEFARKIIAPLNQHHKKFGVDALHVVATGQFQEFNKLHPSEFSCAIYAKSVKKGTVPIFPLIYWDEPDRNPQTKYAMIIESALISHKSKTSLAIRGIRANVLAIRGSGISAIQIEDPIQLASSSMPLEYQHNIKVSGSDTLSSKKTYKEIVGYYAKQIEDSTIKNRMLYPATIIVGKGARDILEYKLDINLDSFKHYLSLDSITLTSKQAKELYDDVQKRLDGKKFDKADRKKLYRIRNTLAFIVALIDYGHLEKVLLSDAKFSTGLVHLQTNYDSAFHDTMARLGVSGFFDTFLYVPNTTQMTRNQHSTVSRLSKLERFSNDIKDSIVQIQNTLDANGMEFNATDLFRANTYPYISNELKLSLVQDL
jgi:hypothetical protein